MSDTSAFGFGKFVPGFDFLQNLGQAANPAAKGSPQGMPNMASWVAPTLSVEELDKRIQELKTVQFWLEQNTNALKATIQALEVQKMTLSTLQGMNVNMTELAKAFTAKMPDLQPKETPKPAETHSAASSSSEVQAQADPVQLVQVQRDHREPKNQPHEFISLWTRHAPAVANGRRFGHCPIARPNDIAWPCTPSSFRIVVHH